MGYIEKLRKKIGHDPAILVVVLGIATRGEKILAVRKRGRGDWGLPGGFMELGETAAQTLRREFFEETQLDTTPEDLLGVYTNYPSQEYPNGDKAHVVHIIFTCSVSGIAIPDGDEIEEVSYVEPVNIKHREIIEDYIKGNRGVIR